ncbi:hypothetical protein N657DRAFT_651508, partial [Parathielavia appendiculata]
MEDPPVFGGPKTGFFGRSDLSYQSKLPRPQLGIKYVWIPTLPVELSGFLGTKIHGLSTDVQCETL